MYMCVLVTEMGRTDEENSFGRSRFLIDRVSFKIPVRQPYKNAMIGPGLRRGLI